MINTKLRIFKKLKDKESIIFICCFTIKNSGLIVILVFLIKESVDTNRESEERSLKEQEDNSNT